MKKEFKRRGINTRHDGNTSRRPKVKLNAKPFGKYEYCEHCNNTGEIDHVFGNKVFRVSCNHCNHNSK